LAVTPSIPWNQPEVRAVLHLVASLVATEAARWIWIVLGDVVLAEAVEAQADQAYRNLARHERASALFSIKHAFSSCG
jgi:hypothetical protein